MNSQKQPQQQTQDDHYSHDDPERLARQNHAGEQGTHKVRSVRGGTPANRKKSK